MKTILTILFFIFSTFGFSQSKDAILQEKVIVPKLATPSVTKIREMDKNSKIIGDSVTIITRKKSTVFIKNYPKAIPISSKSKKARTITLKKEKQISPTQTSKAKKAVNIDD